MNTYDYFSKRVLLPPIESGQFTSWIFSQNLRHHRLLGSMGTVGDCFDNSPMESYWGSIQIELLNRQRWTTYVTLVIAMATTSSTSTIRLVDTARSLTSRSTSLSC